MLISVTMYVDFQVKVPAQQRHANKSWLDKIKYSVTACEELLPVPCTSVLFWLETSLPTTTQKT